MGWRADARLSANLGERDAVKDKWALVTGATAGLGWAVAESLAGAGANIVLHDLTAPTEAADRLSARYRVSVIPAAADLSQRASIETMMTELLGRCGDRHSRQQCRGQAFRRGGEFLP